MPITKLRSGTLTQQCAGFTDPATALVPCIAVNSISTKDLHLGHSHNQPLIVGTGDAGFLVSAQTTAGMMFSVVDPGVVTASTTCAVAAPAVTITVSRSMAGITATVADIVTAFRGRSGARALGGMMARGDGSGLAQAVPATALTYSNTPINKDLILLPPCPTCGIQEVIQRTWDTIPVGEDRSLPFVRRKLATNFLAQKLRQLGRVHPLCAASVSAEVTEPPEQLPGFPSGDGTL